jgi:exosome complex component RRP4
VDVILGLNGYIWISKHVKANEQEGEQGFDAEAVYSNQNDVRTLLSFVHPHKIEMLIVQKDIDSATRTAISRVSNIVKILAAHFIPLSDTLLLDAYAWTMEQEASDVKRLLLEDYGDALVAAVAAG